MEVRKVTNQVERNGYFSNLNVKISEHLYYL